MKGNSKISKAFLAKGFLPVSKVAETLGISSASIYDYMKEGAVKPYFNSVNEDGTGKGLMWLNIEETKANIEKAERDFASSFKPVQVTYKPRKVNRKPKTPEQIEASKQKRKATKADKAEAAKAVA